jgi:hypothetical protein
MLKNSGAEMNCAAWWTISFSEFRNVSKHHTSNSTRRQNSRPLPHSLITVIVYRAIKQKALCILTAAFDEVE